jgi:hypothetical protein
VNGSPARTGAEGIIEGVGLGKDVRVGRGGGVRVGTAFLVGSAAFVGVAVACLCPAQAHNKNKPAPITTAVVVFILASHKLGNLSPGFCAACHSVAQKTPCCIRRMDDFWLGQVANATASNDAGPVRYPTIINRLHKQDNFKNRAVGIRLMRLVSRNAGGQEPIALWLPFHCSTKSQLRHSLDIKRTVFIGF